MAVDIVVDVGEPSVPDPSAGCDTTLRTAINRTRTELLSGRREERNRLATDIASGATSLELDFAKGGIDNGSRLGIDLELFHVYSVTGQTVTVEPAEGGSIAADHDNGTIIRVNSRATDFDILNAINDTLRDLSSPGAGLFRVGSVDLTLDSNLDTYDLTDAANVYDILGVWYPVDTGTQQWSRVANKHWRLIRDADVSAFASGFGLQFFSGFSAADGTTIRVTYKTRYNLLADYADNVESVAGLHCDAHDLLWIGAAIRLSDTREIERNQTMSQGEPRRASEVPAGALNNSVAGLQRRWSQRIRDEASRLARQYPVYYR